MQTYNDLWGQTSRALGYIVPTSTFRRWLTDYCLLDIKAEYSDAEVTTVEKLAELARSVPRSSPKLKQKLHQLMRESHDYQSHTGTTVQAE
jgi:hypothetical protein